MPNPATVVPLDRPPIDHLPPDVQARIILLEAISSFSSGMLRTAHEINPPSPFTATLKETS